MISFLKIVIGGHRFFQFPQMRPYEKIWSNILPSYVKFDQFELYFRWWFYFFLEVLLKTVNKLYSLLCWLKKTVFKV